MPYYKAQHEVFIRALIRHGDQLLAYRQAYPKASKESAYTAAIRLLRRPHIQQRVAAAMQQHAAKEQLRAQEREEHKRRMAEEDTLQKRLWLARVVRGEVMKQRYMQFRGRTILLHETLNPFITLAAIELDTRYEYGTNPKIILDRQFARLYARAMRPVGLALINRTSPRSGSAATSPFKGGARDTTSFALAKEQQDPIPPLKGDAPQGQGDVSRKNTQNAPKKLTGSKQNPRPAIHTASNNPAVCNKIKSHPVRTSAASVHRAETHVVILSEVECSGTQGRICLIKDTATSKQILRDAQNDSLDCATSDTAALQEISPYGRNDGYDGTTSDTAESRQILRDAQNDSLDGRQKKDRHEQRRR